MPLLAAGTGLDVTVRLYAEQLVAGVRQTGRGREQARQRRARRRRRAEGRARRRLHHDRGDQRGDGDPADVAQESCPTIR